MGDITGVNGSSIINSQQTDEVKNSIASRGDSVLSGGIAVLYMFMNLLSEMADAKYSQMQDKADVSREAQSKANEMDEKIADCNREENPAKAKADVPKDVVEYMKKNGVTVGKM